MSDARAIEGVTDTLLQVIYDAVNKSPGGYDDAVKVIAKPPQEVKTDVDDYQVNLFLYRTEIAAGLRNEDPVDLESGETAIPPLPLVLHYLITPYVQAGADNELHSHRLLGLASRALHERPVLSHAKLAGASGGYSNVSTQLDRIRVTWQPLAENDIYSLWSAFQAPYRLSAAFEVRAVLIDAKDPPISPLPVLARGDLDQGPTANADIASPFPELDAAIPKDKQTAARLGEAVRLEGRNLSADIVVVNLTHPLLRDPIAVDPDEITGDAVTITVPDAAQDVPAGLWSASLTITKVIAGQPITTVTNEVPLAVAPTIEHAPISVVRDNDETAHVAVTCEPYVIEGQNVLLIVAGRAIAEERAVAGDPADPVVGENLTFEITHAPLGKHVLRLRVGGVDSVLIDRSEEKPRFDPTQTLTVTAPP